MTECMNQFTENSYDIAWNSGKFLTQLGLYQDCLDKPDFKYGLLEIFNKTTSHALGVSMGTCMPEVCPKDQIQSITDSLFDLVKLDVFGIYVESPNNYEPETGFPYYFTLCLIGIILVAVLIATVLSKQTSKVAGISSFNLKNALKIFVYKENQLNIFNGVKTLCMCWVIFGHLFSIRLQNIVNVLTVEPTVQEPFFLLVLAAFFAVDVFFYIGGFLVAYSFLRNTMKSVLKYPLAIVHRILRFWPSYIMTILIYLGLFLHMGDGPLWWTVQRAGQVNNCKTIWKPLLFVDNLVDNGNSMCLGWGWYLQNDMQIFIASIPVLFLYNHSKKFGFLAIWILIIGSLIANFVEVQVNQYITVAHRIDFLKWNSYFPNVYIKPWIRCPPYFYGLTLGLLYMDFLEAEKSGDIQTTFFGRVKKTLEKRKMVKNIVQLLGIALLLFIVLIPRTLQVGHHWPQAIHSLYLTFGKFFFVIGVSMILTPALLKVQDDFIFFLLDTKFFNFTSKISFWTYLVHYMIIEVVAYGQKTDFYYSIGNVLYLYFGIVFISMFFGFVGTMLVEVPFAKLQKMLFERKKKHHGPKPAKHETESHEKAELNQERKALNETVTTQGKEKNS